ncbi:uncharacterized protein EV154DRAFT_560811 [Mucor mucedo]|uniref:uncharacterized protein n=1 Tax=Mucor mucedo TaxID=29922 RepID=UPI0022210D9B|nr:uncharacterized protein EV154DRAFT_560811 [Mucor mucedo]KAI7894045.1 hypothetical protein EV154DRAFT_560811 [Mucor mucedo]
MAAITLSQLRKQYRPPTCDTTEYGDIGSILKPIFQAYRGNKAFDNNWIKIPVFNPEHADTAFCIFFSIQVLSIIRYNPRLFDIAIDSSGWAFVDYLSESLISNLTMNDTISEAAFKIDLRIINDEMKQRYNTEHDVAVLETAAEDASNAKFNLDRYKISIENKVILENYLLDSTLLNSVNSLQVSDLRINFLNTTLKEPGFYLPDVKDDRSRTVAIAAATVVYPTVVAVLRVTTTVRDITINYQTMQPLCFRDDYILKSNTYNEHLVDQKN